MGATEGSGEPPSGTDEPLVLVDSDPGWPEQFAEARKELLLMLGDYVRRIEHIGSTAVPGLLAKPVIDILLVVDETEVVLDRRPELAAVGYTLEPDAWPDPRAHLFFRGEAGGRRTRHLHVVPAGSSEIDDYLAVREHLRNHLGEIDAYAAHKAELAAMTGGDRDRYVATKPAYVEALLGRSRSS